MPAVNEQDRSRIHDDENEPMQPSDIADELDVSASGARWLIDTGRIPAQRTAHGQRIARRGDVLRYKARRDAERNERMTA